MISFINNNKHLPDIPTEEKVLADGLSLGEMDSRLLQKIEELTLYIIDLNNQIRTLEDKLKALEVKQ